MNTSSLICPVSSLNYDKNVARIGATLTALFLGLYAYTGNVGILAFIVLDYIIRVFTHDTRPPIGHLARWIARGLGLRSRPTNRGPKMFAWRVGLLFAVSALVLSSVDPAASIIVAIALLGFNVLDGVCNFCVGCVVYTYITLPLMNARNTHAPE